MPLQTSNEELNAILELIKASGYGMSISQLMAKDRIDIKRRTLQRRLDLLSERGLIRPEGNGRGRRYLIADQHSFVRDSTVDEVPQQQYEWLSAEALEIRRIVKLPLSQRKPVGYDTSFLSSYQPNTTFYLPKDTRKHLAKIGQVGITDLPAGTYLRQILDRLLIDLAWNSSRLEGNTYSLLETKRLLELGESVEGKATQEAQMILNHKAAIEMLADPTEEIGFNPYTVCNLHALLSDNLMSDPAACGSVRHRAVGISGSVFYPLEVPQMIEENFLMILNKANEIEDPFEASFFVMVQMPYLQAFEDVNKRVSRLAANIPMVRHNLCPLSFVDVEADDYVNALIGVYELQRVEYLRDVFVRAYTRSSERYKAVRQSLGEPDPFRMKYRNQIGNVVRKVVKSELRKDEAEDYLEKYSNAEIPEDNQPQFTKTIRIELHSLHEGNIARYRLRPTEFTNWKSKQVSVS